VTNPTNATTGALKQANPGGARQKWLLGVDVFTDQLGTLLLYDRLMQMGGSMGLSHRPRRSRAARRAGTPRASGNVIFLEVYVAVGATATTAVCSYTNQAGVARRAPWP
jgi:hypothetical protein